MGFYQWLGNAIYKIYDPLSEARMARPFERDAETNQLLTTRAEVVADGARARGLVDAFDQAEKGQPVRATMTAVGTHVSTLPTLARQAYQETRDVVTKDIPEATGELSTAYNKALAERQDPGTDKGYENNIICAVAGCVLGAIPGILLGGFPGLATGLAGGAAGWFFGDEIMKNYIGWDFEKSIIEGITDASGLDFIHDYVGAAADIIAPNVPGGKTAQWAMGLN